jgi:transcriptional regulator with XRE-family HTH domain
MWFTTLVKPAGGIVDVCLAIKQRLEQLGLEQRDLAAAVQVTESYISQLLRRKKAPPAAERTDIYEKMTTFLKLPKGKLVAMVEAQRREELKKKISEPPAPLFKEVRKLVIQKCKGDKRTEVRAIFERQAFGELERLITQKLLDVAKKVAKDELRNEGWLRIVADLLERSYEEMRASVLEFLDTDVFNISPDHCSAFLDPLVESWDIDLTTFAIEIVLNKRLAAVQFLRFRFVETEAHGSLEEEPGFREFCRNAAMSGGATDQEMEFLKSIRFKHNRPSALYYYRELQSLRDPLHFLEGSKRRDSGRAEKQIQLDQRKKAIQRWKKNKGSASERKGGRSLIRPRSDIN